MNFLWFHDTNVSIFYDRRINDSGRYREKYAAARMWVAAYEQQVTQDFRTRLWIRLVSEERVA